MSRGAAAERKTELPELYVNSARLQFEHGNSMRDQMFVPRSPRMRMVPFQFIKPAVPRLRERPPEGEGWLHEVKFDGWRVQLHKVGREITVFSRNGHDITKRCRWIDEASSISARSVIIDGELVALGVDGRPDFDAMGRRGIATTLCAFDLLELNGRDMRALPLVERRRRLKRLSAAVPTHMLFSGAPQGLFANTR